MTDSFVRLDPGNWPLNRVCPVNRTLLNRCSTVLSKENHINLVLVIFGNFGNCVMLVNKTTDCLILIAVLS